VGQRTDGLLVYGYDLGCEEDWKVRERGEYGEPVPGTGGWVPDPEAEEGYDLIEQAMSHLLAASGFTETYEDGRDGYFGREDAAKAALGVEFETYCSGEYPMYVLAACVVTAGRGDVVDAGAAIAAADDATRQEWDAKLAAALQVLGLTPVQDKPRWLLCSYWG